MNEFIFKGRLTADPEIKVTSSGKSVSTFTVAVNRRFNNEKTDFFNCEAWNKTGEFVSKYFKKGKEILCVGEVHIDKAEVDGSFRYFTKVQVEQVEFCGGKNDVADSSSATPENFVPLDDDEPLPF